MDSRVTFGSHSPEHRTLSRNNPQAQSYSSLVVENEKLLGLPARILIMSQTLKEEGLITMRERATIKSNSSFQ